MKTYVVTPDENHLCEMVLMMCHNIHFKRVIWKIIPKFALLPAGPRSATCKSGVLGLIPGLATYFILSFSFFKKGSCQLLAKVYARSTG